MIAALQAPYLLPIGRPTPGAEGFRTEAAEMKKLIIPALIAALALTLMPVSYTHLTLPTKALV